MTKEYARVSYDARANPKHGNKISKQDGTTAIPETGKAAHAPRLAEHA
jgi:hypothetical protein